MQRHYPLNPATGLEDASLLPWANGNPSTGTEGSYPGFGLFTDAMEELLAAITASGQTPSSSDLAQLSKAIPQLAQKAVFGNASGTNTYTVALTPAPAALTTGQQILVYFANPNTITNPTLAVNTLGAKPIVKQQGGAMVVGDLTGFVPLIYDGTNWRFNGLAPSSAGRLINVQIFTTSGSYVPSTGMTSCVVEAVGGGAAGGGASGASGAGNVSLGAPGTAGAYARATYTAAQIGVSQSVVIGAGGSPVSGGTGGNGGSTILGALLYCPGGVGGNTLTNQVAPTVNSNGTTTAAATGANITQQPGSVATATIAVSAATGIGGQGGSNPLGTGGYGSNVNSPGAAGTGNGAGGAGGFVNASGGSVTGGAGSPGKIIIMEYGA